MIQVTVHVDLGPLQRFQSALDADFASGGTGPIRVAFKQWAARYRAFLRERFSKFSRGGGDWPPLSPATIAGRRKGKGSSKFKLGAVAILIDTGTLFAALDPVWRNAPGALEENIPYGIEVGYGGAMRHPGGVATIADIASFHQTGGPRLPKREIIVSPSDQVVEGMRSDMERALEKLERDTGNH